MKSKHPSRTIARFSLATAIALAAASSTHAADLTWDSGDTTNGAIIDPASGTWNTTAENIVWNNAGTNVAWSAANVAIFGGADGAYAIDVAGPFRAQSILFANSGYTLSAGTAQTITVTSGGQPGIRVSSGKTATIASNVTVTEDNGTMSIGALNGASGGTLNIEGTVRSGGTGSTVIDGVGTIVNVKTGGILRAAGTSGGSLAVGQLANSDNSLNVQGGSVLVERSGQSFLVGNQGQATVTLTSGNITIAAHAFAGGVVFSADANNDTKSNTFHLNGGILTTSMVRTGAGDSTATFNFNGGTLKANASNTSFMTALNAANVKADGAKIDTQAFNIEIAQDLLHDPALDIPSVTPDGGLEKLGSGTLTLTGANTYTGDTTVSEGTLTVTGSLAATAVEVKNNATLAGDGLLGGNVTVRTGGHQAFEVADLAGFQPTRTITGSLTLEADSIIDLTAVSPPAPGGPYVLLTAAGGITGTPGSVTLNGLSGSVVKNGNNLELTVTAPAGFASWIADPAFGLAEENQYPTDDSENDGITNLMEYVLNGNPGASSTEILPTADNSDPTDLIFTFTRREESAADTTQIFQYGTDLSGWTDINITGTPDTEVTLGTPALGLQLVTVKVPKSAAVPSGKLFGRLQITQP